MWPWWACGDRFQSTEAEAVTLSAVEDLKGKFSEMVQRLRVICHNFTEEKIGSHSLFKPMQCDFTTHTIDHHAKLPPLTTFMSKYIGTYVQLTSLFFSLLHQSILPQEAKQYY